MIPGYLAPFRWPDVKQKLTVALSKEVANYFPEKPQEWDEVATILCKAFSTDDKQVKGREKYTKLQFLY